MGYEHRAWNMKCGYCGANMVWFWKDSRNVSREWTCKCGAVNFLKTMPEWPEVPRSLYIGLDKYARFKVYPIPPDRQSTDNLQWAKPYSVRSFMYQASRKFGQCWYMCNVKGMVMDEVVFSDHCFASGDDWDQEWWECHMASGWMTGQDTCTLWEHIQKLCQTDTERNFLHRYLGYVKDRSYPMLIPQAWIGIAERRRPDFVAFVPLQYWNYKWIAIQLDGAHGAEKEQADMERDEYVRQHKYEVMSLRPNEMGYFEEVRRLVEHFEQLMTLADTRVNDVAVNVPIEKVTKPPSLSAIEANDIPF